MKTSSRYGSGLVAEQPLQRPGRRAACRARCRSRSRAATAPPARRPTAITRQSERDHEQLPVAAAGTARSWERLPLVPGAHLLARLAVHLLEVGTASGSMWNCRPAISLVALAELAPCARTSAGRSERDVLSRQLARSVGRQRAVVLAPASGPWPLTPACGSGLAPVELRACASRASASSARCVKTPAAVAQSCTIAGHDHGHHDGAAPPPRPRRLDSAAPAASAPNPSATPAPMRENRGQERMRSSCRPPPCSSTAIRMRIEPSMPPRT